MVVFAATIATESFAESTSGQWPLVFFHAGFEGDLAAQASGEVVKPEDVTEAVYVESEHSKAISLAAGSAVRYDLPDGFPFGAGSLELGFRHRKKAVTSPSSLDHTMKCQCAGMSRHARTRVGCRSCASSMMRSKAA